MHLGYVCISMGAWCEDDWVLNQLKTRFLGGVEPPSTLSQVSLYPVVFLVGGLGWGE